MRALGREPVLPAVLRRGVFLPSASVRPLVADALAPAHGGGQARRADPSRSGARLSDPLRRSPAKDRRGRETRRAFASTPSPSREDREPRAARCSPTSSTFDIANPRVHQDHTALELTPRRGTAEIALPEPSYRRERHDLDTRRPVEVTDAHRSQRLDRALIAEALVANVSSIVPANHSRHHV